MTEADFQKFTKPTLRLFLSVDLENSTRLKQAEPHKERWLAAVLNFFREFPQLYRSELQSIAPVHGRDPIEPGPPWKMLGDEMIFVVEVEKSHEVKDLVSAFKQAIGRWNQGVAASEERRGQLRVKGCAWCAGFPVFNTVLPEGSREEYVGPSIDCGFRIGKLATARIMPVSVELAWLLLAVGSSEALHFNGPVSLKGLSEEVGYPFVWLETESSQFIREQAKLLGTKRDPEDLKSLCAQFIREFGVPRSLPFIDGVKETPRPPSYDKDLEVMKESLRREIYSIDEPQLKIEKRTPDSEVEEYRKLLREAAQELGGNSKLKRWTNGAEGKANTAKPNKAVFKKGKTERARKQRRQSGKRQK